MTSSMKLQPHILYRLVLSKVIFRKATELCNASNDLFEFSHGLIALHDSLDNFCGAIVSSKNISLTGNKNKKFLLDMIEAIESDEKKSDPNFCLIGKSEIVQINTLRNNIKHQGIVPNANYASGLIVPITSFFEEYCLRYFHVEWNLVSLADSIKDNATRKNIKVIEGLILKGEYKNALTQMAVIKFKVFDELSFRIALDPRYDFMSPSEEKKKLRASKNIFPKQINEWLLSELYDRADLLEKGISREILKKFEELSAVVGINNAKEWKYIFQHDHNWARPNWTKQNVLFCYDFLIDAILKNQRREHNYLHKTVFTVYTIRAKSDIPIYQFKDNLVYTMSAGEERDAMIFERIDNNWELYNQGTVSIKLYEGDQKEDVHGYMKEGDIKNIDFLETRQYTQDDGKQFIRNYSLP